MATDKQVAIVTGAASGLGRAMTLGLLTAGIEVAGVDRNTDGLAGVAEAARERQQLGDARDGVGLVVRFEQRQPEGQGSLGEGRGRVNNAGIGQSGVRADQRRNPIRFWEATPEQWSRFLAVNGTAPIMLARAVLPHMLSRKAGRIITVTTSLGTMVREGYLLYGASKAAAEAAMAVLSNDLKGTGVTANVLVPGGVTDTPLLGDDAGDRARMLRPEVMVAPLLYLVSEAAAGVNGRRFIGADWDASLPPAQAAEKAGAPIAWMSIARMPIEPA